jgi:hypothetical protein
LKGDECYGEYRVESRSHLRVPLSEHVDCQELDGYFSFLDNR